MRLSTSPRRSFRAPGRTPGLFTAGVLAAAVLAGCSSSSTAGTSETSSAAPSVAKDPALAAMLPASVVQRGTLRVAVPDGSAPLSSVDDSGKPVGMDPDFAKALGGLLGLKVELTAGSFDSQIPGLQAGRYDIAMGEYYVTPARLANVDFVTDWRDYSSFATRVDDKWDPKTGDDLCGHSVGVMKGSAEESSVTELAATCTEKLTINAFPDQAASFLALNSSRIDAVVTGRGPLEAAAGKNKSFKISGEYGGGPCATAVARTDDSAQMLAALKAGFDELIANGSYADIVKEWGTDYGAADSAEIFTQDSTPPTYS